MYKNSDGGLDWKSDIIELQQNQREQPFHL